MSISVNNTKFIHSEKLYSLKMCLVRKQVQSFRLSCLSNAFVLEIQHACKNRSFDNFSDKILKKVRITSCYNPSLIKYTTQS